MRRRAFVRLNRLGNAVVRTLGLRRFRGADLLFLTTTGRRSGQQRTTPLLYLREPDGWVVVASNGGADWEPGWWLNLRAGSPGTVRIGSEAVAVTATRLVGAEREAMWRTLNQDVFDYDSYQRKVRRQISVVRLTPQVRDARVADAAVTGLASGGADRLSRSGASGNHSTKVAP